MKSVLQFVFAALVLSCALFSTACGDYGTIIVKNNYASDVAVTVYSDPSPLRYEFTHKTEYGPKTIAAGSSANFKVSSDTLYEVYWHSRIWYGKMRYGKMQIKADVSNGNTVEVTIP
jgi:hypothetical protein